MNWNNKENAKLIEAVLSLKSKSDAEKFFRDLLTESEITEFAKRLKAAEMLSQNIPYSTIERETGFSSTTVARVSKWLNQGKGGYKLILNNFMHHTTFPNKERNVVMH